jgi:hypothetical protein
MFRKAVVSTPSTAVGDERLCQVANAEVFGLEVLFAQGLGKMVHGLLAAVEFVAALQFTIFQSHVKCSR